MWLKSPQRHIQFWTLGFTLLGRSWNMEAQLFANYILGKYSTHDLARERTILPIARERDQEKAFSLVLKRQAL